MTILNLNPDRFEEPSDAPTGTPAEQSFAEGVHWRLHHLMRDVTAHTGKRPKHVSVSCEMSADGYIWCATVYTIIAGQSEVRIGSGATHQSAVSNLLSRLPVKPDLASILGYTEQ